VAAEMANITRELQLAESQEEWDRYEELQKQFAQLTQQTDGNRPPRTIVTPAPENTRAEGNPTRTNVTSVEDNTTTTVVVEPGPRATSPDINCEDDQFEDDDVNMGNINEHPAEEEENVRVGSIFCSAKDLQGRLQALANTQKFKVRLEKNAVVCANAGQSNWTGVCDSETRAQQALRKIQKFEGEGYTPVEDNLANNLEDILQTEKDKVGTKHCFTPCQALLTFSPMLFVIGEIQEVTAQEFDTLWLYVARPLQETRQK
jgi:hypothetical protein